MLSQPPAASADAWPQSGFGRSTVPATASTRAADSTSGRWLIAATARSCSSALMRSTRAAQATAIASTRAMAASSPDGTSTQGRSLNNDASDASNPVTSRPAIGWPPTKRRPSSAASSTMAAFVLATSVTTASAARYPAQRSAEVAEQRQRGKRRRGEDHDVRALDGGLGTASPRRR